MAYVNIIFLVYNLIDAPALCKVTNSVNEEVW